MTIYKCPKCKHTGPHEDFGWRRVRRQSGAIRIYIQSFCRICRARPFATNT
jgi:hypothetical protein